MDGVTSIMVNDMFFTFDYNQSASIHEHVIKSVAFDYDLESEVHAFKETLDRGTYSNPRSSVLLPFDRALHDQTKRVAQQKKLLAPTVLVVVGIGGSSLGAKAVHQAIHGRFYHANEPVLRVYFAETVDADRMFTILTVLEKELIKGHAVLITVITKSGTTTETIANFHVLLSLLIKHRPHDYKEYIVAITDKDSPLWRFASEEGYALLPIPKVVGGRYSVFSPVGLFPLLMAGVDTDLLLQGAQESVARCTNFCFETNPALMSALLQFIHYKRGISISDLFLFSVDLESVGKWYRQLMGESIGKEFDKNGKKVGAGITPTVSLGSIDLHSLAQLYLGGPRDKFTTFVTIETTAHQITINPELYIEQVCSNLRGKRFDEVMYALVEGTKRAYLKNDRPYCSVVLPEKTERYIGQFLQFKMMEMVYLAYLLHVDPFDQPNVELYKRETHALLAK